MKNFLISRNMKGFKKFLICLFLGFFLLSLCSCSKEDLKKNWEEIKNSFHIVKEETFEKVKVFLKRVPFVGKHIHLGTPPKEEFNKARDLMVELQKMKADKFFPEKFQALSEKWQEIEDAYKYKYYFKTRLLLKEFLKEAQAIKQSLDAYYQRVEQKHKEVYEKVKKLCEKMLNQTSDSQKKLKINLFLWELKTLLSVKNFDLFEKVLKNPPFNRTLVEPFLEILSKNAGVSGKHIGEEAKRE